MPIYCDLNFQTRDQVSVPLRDETYSSEASVLDPIKPMFANDPYSFYEEPVMMDDYYYEDYYDSIPDFSPLKGNQIQTKSIPPVPKVLIKYFTFEGEKSGFYKFLLNF